MKKVYYLKKEIGLGDLIEFRGIKILVTQTLINDNPDIFIEMKSLSLKDYESKLTGGYNEAVCKGIHSNSVYIYLRYVQPKLFYAHILQLIASDLNGDWKPKIGEVGFFIYFDGEDYIVKSHNSVKYAMVYFKSSKAAKRAIEILGEKLDICLNN